MSNTTQKYNGWSNYVTWCVNLLIGEFILYVDNVETKEDLIENIYEYIQDLDRPHSRDIIHCGIDNIDFEETLKNMQEFKKEFSEYF